MISIGGRSLLVAVLLAAVPVACSAGGDGSEGASGGARSTASTTTEAEGEARTGSTTEPDEPSTTLRAPDPIPWDRVVAVTATRTGRLHQSAGAVWDDTGEVLEGGGVEEVIEFDRDRLLAERTITIDEGLPDAPEGPLRVVYTEDGTYLSAPWVEERCDAAWVSMDGAMAELGLAETVVASELFPVDPLGPLSTATPLQPPAKVTRVATTYDVDLPALLILSPSYVARNPEVAAGLEDEVVRAAVTIHDDGALDVEMRLPFTAMREAGAEGVDEMADEVSMWTRWALDDVGEPTAIEVPADIAADPACAE